MENDKSTLFDYLEDDDFSDIDDEDQSGVVDQTETDDATDEGTEGEPDGEADDPDVDGAATHQQSRELNNAFAAARRDAEARERQAAAERDEAIAQVNVLRQALAEYGYEGTPQEIADAIVASRQGTTAEAVRQQREREQQAMDEAIRNHPAVKRAEQLEQQITAQQTNALLASELRNIQKINPEIRTLSDLRNLGDKQEMFDAMVKGGMHIDKAYQAVSGMTVKPQMRQDTKGHIRTVNGSTTGKGVTLSKEELSLAREMGLSAKEINDWCRKNGR